MQLPQLATLSYSLEVYYIYCNVNKTLISSFQKRCKLEEASCGPLQPQFNGVWQVERHLTKRMYEASFPPNICLMGKNMGS